MQSQEDIHFICLISSRAEYDKVKEIYVKAARRAVNTLTPDLQFRNWGPKRYDFLINHQGVAACCTTRRNSVYRVGTWLVSGADCGACWHLLPSSGIINIARCQSVCVCPPVCVCVCVCVHPGVLQPRERHMTAVARIVFKYLLMSL